MSPEDVLRVLRKSEGPDRRLDKRIAPFAGLVRSVEGPDDTVAFLDASGQSVKVPPYTRDLDAAYSLVEAMLPGSAVAVTWESGAKYRAQIMGGRRAEANDPSLAICIAAFSVFVGENPNHNE